MGQGHGIEEQPRGAATSATFATWGTLPTGEEGEGKKRGDMVVGGRR
jgi:hypothetical protein